MAGPVEAMAITAARSEVTPEAIQETRRRSATSAYAWRNVQIVGGGFVSGIITHPREKGLMYARTDIGGAYRWDATRKQWAPLTDWVTGDDWTLTGIESLAIDPSDPKRVYLAAGTYTNSWSGNGSILRSEDRGATWKRTPMPFKMGGNEDGRSNGERLAVEPNDGRILFFGSRATGLWRSADRGVTWAQVDRFPAVATSPSSRSGTGEWDRAIGIVFVQFFPNKERKDKPTQTIYAGVSTPEISLFRSTDGGATWNPVPGQPTGLRPHHVALSPDNNALYLTYGNHPGPNNITDGAVWKLDPRSDTWTNITPLKPGESDRFGYGGVTVDARKPGTVMVSTMDRWARKDELFRSTDSGKTWKPIGPRAVRDHSLAPWLTWGRPQTELGHWIGDIEIDPFDSNRVLYVTGTGIWASLNVTEADADRPTRWVVGAKGLEECVVNEVLSPPSGASLLSVVWDIDGFRHEDLNASPPDGFFKPAHGHNTSIDFAEGDPNVVARVFGGDRAQGAYSLDNGRTWTDFSANPPGSRGQGMIAVSADGGTFVWTPSEGAPHVSRDRGAAWTACAGIPARLRVVADRVNPSTFYAFDREGGLLYASTDGGATFTPWANNLPRSEGFLRAVPGKAGHLWLASRNGLLRSTDGGVNFVKHLGVQEGRRIGFGKAAPGRNYPALYVVGKVEGIYGIFRSDDEAGAWVRVNDDQHQFGSLNSITGDPRVYGRVYLGSANRGILYGEPGT